MLVDDLKTRLPWTGIRKTAICLPCGAWSWIQIGRRDRFNVADQRGNVHWTTVSGNVASASGRKKKHDDLVHAGVASDDLTHSAVSTAAGRGRQQLTRHVRGLEEWQPIQDHVDRHRERMEHPMVQRLAMLPMERPRNGPCKSHGNVLFSISRKWSAKF